MSTFAHAHLKALRHNAGQTREQLAVALGRSHGTITAWERGTSAPNAEALYLLAAHFDVTIDSLYNGTAAP